MSRIFETVPCKKVDEWIEALPDHQLILVDGDVQYPGGEGDGYAEWDAKRFTFSKLLQKRSLLELAFAWGFRFGELECDNTMQSALQVIVDSDEAREENQKTIDALQQRITELETTLNKKKGPR